MECISSNCYPKVDNCIYDIPLRTPTSPTAGLEKQCSGYVTQNYSIYPVDYQQMTIGDLTSFWNLNYSKCVGNYNEILYTYSDGRFKYNPDKLSQIQDDFYVLLNLAFGDDLSGFNNTSNTELQEKLLKACRDVPGACDAYLCNKLCKSFTYDFLSENPAVTDWCGCYIQPDNADVLMSNITPQQVTPDDKKGANPCYPLCHRVGNIPLFSSETGVKYSCNSNVCVIDNVTVNSVNSTLGDVNITQICPACSPDQLCECIISSNDLPETFEELGLTSNFTSYCGSNGQCYVLEGDGNLTPVNCNDYLKIPVTEYLWVYIIAGICGLLVIIIAIGVFLASKNRQIKINIPSTHLTPEDNISGL